MACAEGGLRTVHESSGETNKQPLASNCLEARRKMFLERQKQEKKIAKVDCSKLTSMSSCPSPTPRTQRELGLGGVRCCDNICGPIPQSPCGYFYAASVFNTCRFKNSFQSSSLNNGLTGYVPVNPKLRGMGKQISSHTLHGIDSVNDLRSWSTSPEDKRRYFLDHMEMSVHNEYGSEYDNDGHPAQLYDNLRDPPAHLANIQPTSVVVTSLESQSNSGAESSNSPKNQSSAEWAMADQHRPGVSGANNGKVSLSDATSSGGGKNKRGNSAASQTPPLALANLVDAMDDEEKKRLFEELLKAENLRPVSAEVRENEQARAALQNSLLKMDPSLKSDICSVYNQVVQDADTFKNLSDLQYRAILNALAFICEQNSGRLSQVGVDDPRIGDSYTFELETTCDFKIDETSGELSLVATQGKIISSASSHGGSRRSSSRSQSGKNSIEENIQSAPPPPSPGSTATRDAASGPPHDSVAGGDELGPINVSNVNWELLQKSQDGRMNEADARVEAEILKTKIDMLKQALEQEKQRHEQPSCNTNGELEKLLCDEHGRAEQLEDQVDQQRLEIAELQRRLQEAEQQECQVDQLRLEIADLQQRLEEVEQQECQVDQQRLEIAELQQRLHEAEQQQGRVSDQAATFSGAGCPNINSNAESIAVQNRRLIDEIHRLENELNARMPDLVDSVMLNATHDFVRRAAMNAEPERLRSEPDPLALVELSRDYANLSAEFDRLQTLVLGCDRIRVGENTANRRKQSQRWVELYLRAKSYRKALAWQKKYLSIVIQGYKDLMGQTGLQSAFEHPDLFQKQVPMTPSSIGLCDCRKGKTRFRVVGRVVIATIRMKYMVNRWGDKMLSKSVPQFQKKVEFRVDSVQLGFESLSSENEENKVTAKTTKFNTAFSPPTKDAGRTTSKTSRSASQSLKRDVVLQVNETSSSRLRSHNRNRTGPSQGQHNNFESRHVSGQPSANNNLSQYLERFEILEKEIGSTIARDGDRVRAVNKNSDKFV